LSPFNGLENKDTKSSEIWRLGVFLYTSGSPYNNSTGIAWELVIIEDTQAPFQTYTVRNSGIWGPALWVLTNPLSDAFKKEKSKKTRSHNRAHGDLKLSILLLQPP
jgi:hypothetical protein